MAKETADLLIERLIYWGVDTIFGLSGDGIDGIFEALRVRQDKIKFIQVRHEEAAAFAACAYAKTAGANGYTIELALMSIMPCAAPRVCHIHDTGRLEEMTVSDALPLARQLPNLEVVTEPQPMQFDDDGRLVWA